MYGEHNRTSIRANVALVETSFRSNRLYYWGGSQVTG